jgi:hypothetical protein
MNNMLLNELISDASNQIHIHKSTRLFKQPTKFILKMLTGPRTVKGISVALIVAIAIASGISGVQIGGWILKCG